MGSQSNALVTRTAHQEQEFHKKEQKRILEEGKKALRSMKWLAAGILGCVLCWCFAPFVMTIGKEYWMAFPQKAAHVLCVAELVAIMLALLGVEALRERWADQKKENILPWAAVGFAGLFLILGLWGNFNGRHLKESFGNMFEETVEASEGVFMKFLWGSEGVPQEYYTLVPAEKQQAEGVQPTAVDPESRELYLPIRAYWIPFWLNLLAAIPLFFKAYNDEVSGWLDEKKKKLDDFRKAQHDRAKKDAEAREEDAKTAQKNWERQMDVVAVMAKKKDVKDVKIPEPPGKESIKTSAETRTAQSGIRRVLGQYLAWETVIDIALRLAAGAIKHMR